MSKSTKKATLWLRIEAQNTTCRQLKKGPSEKIHGSLYVHILWFMVVKPQYFVD